jgi:hypothetical protein
MKATDEGLGAPMSERRVTDQALATWRPIGGLGQEEAQSFQAIQHERVTFADPEAALVRNGPALSPTRPKVFPVRARAPCKTLHARPR